MNNYTKYNRDVIPDIEESLSKIAAVVTEHALVLDIGCSSGMMGRFLALNKGCIVDGVDIDESAIESCKSIYRKIAIKNLEIEDLTDVFATEAYDFIIIADVIEHLYSPDKLLNQIKLLVKPHGSIIFSIPNITHIASSLQLLTGNFDYTKNGLLDNTHIRFYSYKNLVEKLKQFGFYVWDVGQVHKDVDETEFGNTQTKLFPDKWLAALIASRSDSLVYQWIVSTRIYPRLDHEKNHSSLKKIKAKPVFTSGLYWDGSARDGFNENNKIIGIQTDDRNNQATIEFEFPSFLDDEISRIRIDPLSAIKSVWIKSAKIIDTHGVVLWDWYSAENSNNDVVSARWLDVKVSSGKIFSAESNDPQWYPALPASVLQQICSGVRFSIVMCDDAAIIDPIITSALIDKNFILDQMAPKLVQLEIIRAELQELRSQLAAITSSRSWKLTAPVRKISRLIKSVLS